MPLHITTRLVRDAAGAALIGRAAGYGSPTFDLVMNAVVPVRGEPMTLSAGSGPGSNAGWDLSPAAVGPTPPPARLGAITVRAAPNPFRAGGALRLTLDRARAVVIDVLDPGGRRVRQVFSGTLASGENSVPWDGRGALGERLPAGLYLVRVRAGYDEGRTKVVLVN